MAGWGRLTSQFTYGGAVMFYCGIDVAKHKHAVVVLDEHGQVHKPAFTAENTHAGMEVLLEVLKPFAKDVCVGLEATGHLYKGEEHKAH